MGNREVPSMKSSPRPDKKKIRHISNRLRRIWKRTFPVFHFGWMLACSLLLAAVVFLAMHGLDLICSVLISSTGFTALTSANFRYFLRSWQGYAVVILFLASLITIAAIIMNGVIFLSDEL